MLDTRQPIHQLRFSLLYYLYTHPNLNTLQAVTHHGGKIHVDYAPILDADWLQPSNRKLGGGAAVQEPQEPVSSDRWIVQKVIYSCSTTNLSGVTGV